MERPIVNKGLQVGGDCERGNATEILEFVHKEMLPQLPPEALRQTSEVSVSISCGGVALNGSGYKGECIPFILVKTFGSEKRQLSEIMYTGNLKSHPLQKGDTYL